MIVMSLGRLIWMQTCLTPTQKPAVHGWHFHTRAEIPRPRLSSTRIFAFYRSYSTERARDQSCFRNTDVVVRLGPTWFKL
ncbi:hypothetical protein PM082_024904 [Marasmius tenuissimus]|nr:hypothetical protein PM082_024904 [Marasmius tenuissimus]